MLEYVHLDQTSSSNFSHFVLPEAKALFMEFPSSLYAIGATFSGRPVGLALAELDSNQSVAHVKMIYVTPDFRRQGIGKGLIRTFEQTLQSSEIRFLSVEFLPEKDQMDIHLFLESCGFQSPQPGIHIRQGPLAYLMELEWMTLTFPEGYKIEPWTSITPAEREKVKSEVDVVFLEMFSPFPEEELIDKELSLLVRYKGKLAGWLMLEAFNQDTVLFKTMYMYPRYQRTGQGVVLLAETSRHVIAKSNYTNGIFFVEDRNKPMVQFAQRYLSNAPLESETLWRTHKELG
ncbi:GNAT family N-acetyltransferase [Paenisporosarcina indica]|uniref:GNAT family N-acetyltransferase n=1 Tax=Paenisporosarcina indica TaxID=650093 RepID=UPI00094F7D62|nr:GNAT family N-acetyltransferase [Paenisporosarcina indica]